MKRLVIVAEMPDAAGEALAYHCEDLDLWAETALRCALECDCDEEDKQWFSDVERLFGFRREDASDAFDVVEARVEDMGGAEKKLVRMDFDSDGWAKLGEIARARRVTRKECIRQLMKEAVDARAGAEV